MAGERYLLDTNALIALSRGEESLLRRIEAASEVSVPFVAAGELYYGAFNSARPTENIRKLRDLLSGFSILFPSSATIETYAAIRYWLKKAGTPIPEADLWIAALAMQ
ncbi:MAG: PIN domain-containing protein [Candidatus Omnitrophica bacterium]|nr:Ribonuclease VapC1 [bacterium]NUN95442.1 PIN domain-containing protein [Candidatus Omnitrophota bacterium]